MTTVEVSRTPRSRRPKGREKNKRKKLKEEEKMNPDPKKRDLIVQARHQVGYNHDFRPT